MSDKLNANPSPSGLGLTIDQLLVEVPLPPVNHPDGMDPGVRPATLADFFSVLEGLGAERMWICDYPEFNDDNCHVGHHDPQPEKTRQPRKHTGCGSFIVWRIEEK